MIEISENLFESNSAIDKESGDGGAILYKCDPTFITYSNCTVALVANTFIANSAERKGGAFRYENANVTDMRLIKIGGKGRILQSGINYFKGNSASYGSDFASFPYAISYSILENASGAKVDASSGQILIAAGQEFKMSLKIID